MGSIPLLRDNPAQHKILKCDHAGIPTSIAARGSPMRRGLKLLFHPCHEPPPERGSQTPILKKTKETRIAINGSYDAPIKAIRVFLIFGVGCYLFLLKPMKTRSF